MKSETVKYSALQKLLWMIGGSEISILKKCSTDYNRHAGIGFTVLMTSLFGAFAGGYAGYYFSKSTAGAVVFGLLWGLLIFSIDRTMVVSLKKRPETKFSNYFWQILFRGILAALIAFIISIPLELLIFKDNIDAGLSFYKQDQQIRLKGGQDSLYDPKGDAERREVAEREAKSADSIGRLDPQDAGFRSLVSDFNSKTYELKQLHSALATAHSLSARHYNNSLHQTESGKYVPDRSSSSYQSYLGSKTREKALKGDINSTVATINSLSLDIKQRRENWRKKYETESEAAKMAAGKAAKEITVEKAKMDSLNKVFETSLSKVDESFVVRFDVLTYLANKKTTEGEREFSSIFFLLWLVRVLFFVVEILPTIVKVATPFGMYDMAIYEEEENFKNIKLPAAKKLLIEKLEDENILEKEERERQLKLRLKKEGELHDKLVDEISSTQNLVARKILEEWKEKNLS